MEAETDPLAVVSPNCQLISTKSFLCKASFFFSRIADGNMNALSIVTREKAADHILGRTRLPPVN